METKEVKRLHAEFEVLEGVAPANANFNNKEYYPHDGIFMLKHPEGGFSVVNVVRGDGAAEYCQQFQMCFVGFPNTIDSGRVMDSYEVNDKMDAMRDRYEADLKQKKHEIEQEFEKKRMELEHQHEIRMMEIENEQPKRNSQGEWVSGKTLTEIIKTLTHTPTEA